MYSRTELRKKTNKKKEPMQSKKRRSAWWCQSRCWWCHSADSWCHGVCVRVQTYMFSSVCVTVCVLVRNAEPRLVFGGGFRTGAATVSSSYQLEWNSKGSSSSSLHFRLFLFFQKGKKGTSIDHSFFSSSYVHQSEDFSNVCKLPKAFIVKRRIISHGLWVDVVYYASASPHLCSF